MGLGGFSARVCHLSTFRMGTWLGIKVGGPDSAHSPIRAPDVNPRFSLETDIQTQAPP
jgi:hypothetical protein